MSTGTYVINRYHWYLFILDCRVAMSWNGINQCACFDQLHVCDINMYHYMYIDSSASIHVKSPLLLMFHRIGPSLSTFEGCQWTNNQESTFKCSYSRNGLSPHVPFCDCMIGKGYQDRPLDGQVSTDMHSVLCNVKSLLIYFVQCRCHSYYYTVLRTDVKL